MVLAQDQGQANEAAGLLAQRQYDKDLKAYNTEVTNYENELAAHDKAIQDEKDAVTKAEAQRQSDHRDRLAAQLEVAKTEVNAYEKLPAYARDSTGSEYGKLAAGFEMANQSEYDRTRGIFLAFNEANNKRRSEIYDGSTASGRQNIADINTHSTLLRAMRSDRDAYALVNYKKETIAYKKSRLADTVFTLGVTKLNEARVPDAYAQGHANSAIMHNYTVLQNTPNSGKAVQRNKLNHMIAGGSASSFNAQHRVDLAIYNRQQTVSAGLASIGNSQIKIAQSKELLRLGATIQRPQSPTKISATLNVSGRVPVARGEAEKAQNFPIQFLYGRERDLAIHKQQLLKSAGLRNKGNAEIKVSQGKELARLGVGISSTLGTSRVPVAEGVAAKSQKPFVSPQLTNILKPTTVTKKVKIGKPESEFNRRAGLVLNTQQQAAKSSFAFAEISKAQSTSQRYTAWGVDGKFFYTKIAAENYALSKADSVWSVGDQQFKTEQAAKDFIAAGGGSTTESTTIWSVGDKDFKSEKAAKDFLASEKAKIPFNDAKESSKWTTIYSVGDKEFNTEKEANEFIAIQESKKPFTDKGVILPMESLYAHLDKSAKFNYKKSQDNPTDIIAASMAGISSTTSGIFNMITKGGDLLDKHLFNREITDKRQLFMSPTWSQKGIESATKDMKVQSTTPYLIQPTPITPFEKGNVFEKYGQGAKQQMDKQTWQQNVGQGISLVPEAMIDVASLATGLPLLRRGIGWGVGVIVSPLVKGTVKSAKTMAVTNSPAKVWSVTKTTTTKPQMITTKPTIKKQYGGTTFENPVPNPFGKERRIPYAIKQGIAKIKNVNVGIPRPQTPQTLINAAALTRISLFKAKEKLGKLKANYQISLPSKPQSLIRLSESGKIAAFKAKERIGDRIQTSKDYFNNLSLPKSPLLAYKLKLSGQMAAKKLGQSYQTNKKLLSKKIDKGIIQPIKADWNRPNTSFNANNFGYQSQLPKLKGMGTPKGILDVKYKIQLKAQDVKALGSEVTRQQRLFGSKVSMAGKIFIQKQKESFAITKSNMGKVWYGETQPKAIVPFKLKQELNNLTRTDKVNKDLDFANKRTGGISRVIKDVKYEMKYLKSKILPIRTKLDFKTNIVDRLKASGKWKIQNTRNSFDDVTRRVGTRYDFKPNAVDILKAQQKRVIQNKRKFLMEEDIAKIDGRFNFKPNAVDILKAKEKFKIQERRRYYGGMKHSTWETKRVPPPLDFKPSAVDVLKAKEKGRIIKSQKNYLKELEIKKVDGKFNWKTNAIDILKAKEKARIIRSREIGTSSPTSPTVGINPTNFIGSAKKSNVFYKKPSPFANLEKAKTTIETLKKTGVLKIAKNISSPTKTTNIKSIKFGMIKPKKKSDIWDKKEATTKGTDIGGGLQQIAKTKDGIKIKNIPKTKTIPVKPKKESVPVSSAGVDPKVKSKIRIIPPVLRDNRKKKKLMPSIAGVGHYEPDTVQRIKISQKQKPILSSKLDTKLDSKLDLSVAQNTSQAQKLYSSQIPKQGQKQKLATAQRFRSPTPLKPKAKARVTPKFKGIQAVKSALAFADPPPQRRRVVAAIIPPFQRQETKKRRSKKTKSHDFLGNTRLGNIEGLFKRETIIHGDKKIKKQIKKDKKAGFKGIKLF